MFAYTWESGQALQERGHTPWQLSNMITNIPVHLGQTTSTTITHAFTEANMATQYTNWGTESLVLSHLTYICATFTVNFELI